MRLDRQRGQHWRLPWCPETSGAIPPLELFLLWLFLQAGQDGQRAGSPPWRNAMRTEEQGSLPTPTAKRLPEFQSSPVLPSGAQHARASVPYTLVQALLPQLRGPPHTLEAGGISPEHPTPYASCPLALTMNMTTRREPEPGGQDLRADAKPHRKGWSSGRGGLCLLVTPTRFLISSHSTELATLRTHSPSAGWPASSLTLPWLITLRTFFLNSPASPLSAPTPSGLPSPGHGPHRQSLCGWLSPVWFLPQTWLL